MSGKLFYFSALIVVICLANIKNVLGGATEEQMWASADLMKDVCLKKHPKITKEIAANIRNGIIPDDTDTKCYINCIMEMMQTIKKGKFLYDGALKQVDILLPEDYKDEYRTGITACKTAAVGVKNHCEAAYILLNCLRGKITKFVFP